MLLALLFVAPLGQTLESAAPSPREYRLRFNHTHTNERLDIVYRRGEHYLPEALAGLTATCATIAREKCVISIPTCSICCTI